MGDECNVLRQRMDDSNNLTLKDLKKGEKELPNKKHVRETGEPGEDKLGIPEVVRVENFPEVTVKEPDSQEPEVTNFSYIKTKLRPDAPPFTPESIIPAGMVSHREPEIEELNFVNVDIRSQDDQLIVEPEDIVVPQALKEIKDSTLKPFSLTSTPLIKKNAPKVQIMAVEEEDAVISIPTNDPPAIEATTMPILSDQSRTFSMAFFVRNRTQIAVIIASLVICAILIAYALL